MECFQLVADKETVWAYHQRAKGCFCDQLPSRMKSHEEIIKIENKEFSTNICFWTNLLRR